MFSRYNLTIREKGTTVLTYGIGKRRGRGPPQVARQTAIIEVALPNCEPALLEVSQQPGSPLVLSLPLDHLPEW
jgi:hypothetical protein